MAQTKKQRFKEQKRKKKQPAPVAQKTSSKAKTESSGGPNRVLIGAGALAAVAGIAVAAILIFNPFGSKTEPVATATPTSKATVAPKATAAPVNELPFNDPRRIRTTLIKDYRLMIDTEVADSIAKTCDSGKPSEITARSMGGAASSSGPGNGKYSVLCTSTELKITDLTTKLELKPER